MQTSTFPISADFWPASAVIAPNNFIFKRLPNRAFNIAVGCAHAGRCCYVPSAATIKQGPQLVRYGVTDPDGEWGEYVLLRQGDERQFPASLGAAERTPPTALQPEGHRAVMDCSTTGPYQVNRAILRRGPEPAPFHAWLPQCWSPISEWPSAPTEAGPNSWVALFPDHKNLTMPHQDEPIHRGI